jgi:nickel/cobalt transporter (NicO) family protein
MKPWCLLPFSTAVALSTLLPARASAHLVNTDVGEFYAGMMHPLTSAEHLLPTLALALLANQCGKPAARAALFAFPIALLVGTLAGSRLPPFAFFHLANLLVLVGLGGLLALGDRLKHIPPVAVGGLALLTGVILGYRSGIDMAASKVAAQFIPGVAFTGLIVIALIAAWVPMTSSHFNRTLRTLVGGAFGVAGMVLLLERLTDAALPSARGTRLPGQEDLLAMLRAGEPSVPLVMAALLAVTVWGAGHALTPGHGKTIVAAYLIGSRSTPWHALYLGLTVTLTHTLGVFALGLVALFASSYVLPEQLYP